MTDQELFYRLFSGGNHALPYLIKLRLSADDEEPLFFVNSNQNVLYHGNVYQATSFEYTPPDGRGNGGSLIITGIDNDVIDFVENADSNYILDVVGCLADVGDGTGEVTPIRAWKHMYGTVTISDAMTLEFDMGRDDRLEMQFCPYHFDTDNNRSNA